MENEIRVGLEQPVSQRTETRPVLQRFDPLDQVSFGKPVRRHVRDFGLLFASIGIGIGAWQAYQGRSFLTCSVWIAGGAVFALLGVFAPRILFPVWRLWMKLAHCLSVVMTAVLMTLTWCVGFVPMSYVLKLCGIKRIDLAYGADCTSYWEKRDPKYDDFKRLELQY